MSISPGLEALSECSQVIVDQQLQIAEMISGVELNNIYKIKDGNGQDIYYAAENSEWVARQCLGNDRPFEMMILDRGGIEVIHLKRVPFSCTLLDGMIVSAPPGTVIGTVKETWSLNSRLDIATPDGETVFKLKGQLFHCVMPRHDVEFKVFSPDGTTQVAKICKHWSGLFRELFTDADLLGVYYLTDMNVNMKALILGACILIDYMYFEKVW